MNKIRAISWALTVGNFFFGVLLTVPLLFSLATIGSVVEQGVTRQDIESLLLILTVVVAIAFSGFLWLGTLFRAIDRNFFLKKNTFWSLHCVSELLWVVFLSVGLTTGIEYQGMKMLYLILGFKVLSGVMSCLLIRFDHPIVDQGGVINSESLRSST